MPEASYQPIAEQHFSIIGSCRHSCWQPIKTTAYGFIESNCWKIISEAFINDVLQQDCYKEDYFREKLVRPPDPDDESNWAFALSGEMTLL